MPFLQREVSIDPTSPHVDGRIDRLVQELVEESRSFVTGLFDHDCVSLNGDIAIEPGYRLQVGDTISLKFEQNRRYSPQPRRETHQGFEIVFEDRDLIVVNKWADLLTVPTERGEPHTLVSRLQAHVKHTQRGKGAFVVHRLDREVSGLLVFGKTEPIARALQDQFAAQKPERCYIAIVAGHLPTAQGEWRSYLATGKTLTRYSTRDASQGELAVTRFQRQELLRDTTLVEIQLETGRRNQIRVQFAEAGHPVLGDTRYRPDLAKHPHWPMKRLALHALTLSIQHPSTREILRFASKLPPEMTRFIRDARPNRASESES